MLLLVRHGETEWNVEGRHQGRLDSPLTMRGREQMRAAAAVLARESIDFSHARMVASPLGRARESAGIIASGLGVPISSIEVDTTIAEFDWGSWSGMTNDEIDAAFPGARAERAVRKWEFNVPGGESYLWMSRRVARFVRGLDPSRPTLAVAHEMVNRAIRGRQLGLDAAATLAFAQEQGTIVRIDSRTEGAASTAAAARR